MYIKSTLIKVVNIFLCLCVVDFSCFGLVALAQTEEDSTELSGLTSCRIIGNVLFKEFKTKNNNIFIDISGNNNVVFNVISRTISKKLTKQTVILVNTEQKNRSSKEFTSQKLNINNDKTVFGQFIFENGENVKMDISNTLPGIAPHTGESLFSNVSGSINFIKDKNINRVKGSLNLEFLETFFREDKNGDGFSEDEKENGKVIVRCRFNNVQIREIDSTIKSSG